MSAAAVMSLPRIVRFLETSDCPDSACPHCGASGRYILSFQVEDGRTLAAMRGCAKLFPVSQVAVEHLRLMTKAARLAKNGWKLNRRDSEAVDACEAFFAGTMSERSALSIISGAKSANAARYRSRR